MAKLAPVGGPEDSGSAPSHYFIRRADHAGRRPFKIRLPGPADSAPLYKALECMEALARPAALDIRAAVGGKPRELTDT